MKKTTKAAIFVTAAAALYGAAAYGVTRDVYKRQHTDTLQKPCYTVWKSESTIVSRRCVM